MSENKYVPQVGDEVLVQRKGTVTAVGVASGEVYYRTDAGRTAWCLASEVTLVSRPLPTEPTPIVATVRGVEDVFTAGPDPDGDWWTLQVIDGWRLHQPEHISAWRPWTPEDAA